jgi:hypothetical protein
MCIATSDPISRAFMIFYFYQCYYIVLCYIVFKVQAFWSSVYILFLSLHLSSKYIYSYVEFINHFPFAICITLNPRLNVFQLVSSFHRPQLPSHFESELEHSLTIISSLTVNETGMNKLNPLIIKLMFVLCPTCYLVTCLPT